MLEETLRKFLNGWWWLLTRSLTLTFRLFKYEYKTRTRSIVSITSLHPVRSSWKKTRWTRLDPMMGITLALVLCASLSSVVYFYQQGEITSFADGQSRLMIARSIVDNLQPGPVHLGGIWLPLTQVAMLPTVWNDWMYNSGVSGSTVGVISYVLASLFLFKIIRIVTGNGTSALLGVFAFSSPSMLYMQAVPMSEAPFVAFFVMSVYFLLAWTKEPNRYQHLFWLGISLLLACSTRYEGWLLLPIFTFVLVIVSRRFHFTETSRTQANCTYAFSSVVLGICAWLVWDEAILGDWLYFYRSEYAPWKFAQEAISTMNPEFKTAGNLTLSIKVFSRTTIDNVGWIASCVALVGLSIYAVSKKSLTEKLTLAPLLFPFPFFILSIFEGGSVVILHPDYSDGVNWGTRYGTLMMPAAGFGVGYLAYKVRIKDWAKIGIFVPILAASFIFTWHQGILSLDEAHSNQNGEDAQIAQAAGEWMKEHYDQGRILMQRANNEQVVFTSEISLKNIIHEGNREYWSESLVNPQPNRWIFMRINTVGASDTVWKNLNDTPQLLNNYQLVYEDRGVKIYKLKEIETVKKTSS